MLVCAAGIAGHAQVRVADDAPQAGDVWLLENVRFNVGEKANSDELAKRYAGLCDVFVMDAFGTAHRAQASTHGVAKFALKPALARCWR